MNPHPAEVTHRGPARLRVRIPSRRGNRGFFSDLKREFSDWPNLDRIEINPATGSILFEGERIDAEGILQRALERNLFLVENKGPDRPPGKPPRPMANQVVKPLALLEENIFRLSGGRLDLSGAVFFSLLGTAAAQLLRGNMGAPPWYAALWYAFGLYSKELADRPQEDGIVD